KLVWETSPYLTVTLAILTLVGGLLPAAMAYTGKLIIDAVIAASKIGSSAGFTDTHWLALKYLGFEAIIIVLLEAVRRGLIVAQSLLRALLGQKVNVLILEKSLTLDLTHFENSEFYDKMTKARREASTRPLSLVNRTFSIVQSIISLVAYGVLLLDFSPLAVMILAIASIPSFLAETKFANQAFKIFSWRAPESREQMYLETLIAREDHAKEVKLFQLGTMMLDRYKEIFRRLYIEDKDLTVKRGLWGYLFSSISSIAFYGAYAWIVIETMSGRISIGDMTMYLTVFRQGQGTLSGLLSSIGGMYEDNLYLSSLYDFLEQKTDLKSGIGKIKGPNPQDGIKFENVYFSYPGSGKSTIKNVSFHVKPGEKLAIVGGNGSGKTTLIKLMTKLYSPNSGKITLDGLDLEEWDLDVLHKRIGVIFQNFVHYQFTVGENIGVGDVTNLDDEQRWLESSEKGMSLPFIEDMPAGFKTQLGNWFKGGQELSLGQWQKIALSRAFMRKSADILVLDEPTSAIDAEAEVQIFEHFKSVTKEQMVFLISHRFSTVRMADKIIVLEKGEITEDGTHENLIKADGRYAKLFNLQAAGYL
ncbi:ABC transporter ATP-binding protein, partial [bacterium]